MHEPLWSSAFRRSLGSTMASRALLMVLLSYPLLYFSYKYYVPDFGGNDFFDYYQMYLRPFDIHAAHAPRIFRQLTALCVHAIWKMGIFYNTEISFKRQGYDQAVFFAALLTNYIGLVAAATTATFSADKVCAAGRPAWSLLAGLLCFAGFFAQQGVLTGLTEGLSWFLVSLGFLACLTKSLPTLMLVLLLAVIQRETILVVFGVFAATGLILDRKNWPSDFTILAMSVVGLTAYVAMRAILFPHDNQEQFTPGAIVNALASWPRLLTRSIIFQAFLTQNLLCLLGVLLLAMSVRRRGLGLFLADGRGRWVVCLYAAAAALTVIGFGTMVEPTNIGRILSVLTPIAAPLVAAAMACLLGGEPGSASPKSAPARIY